MNIYTTLETYDQLNPHLSIPNCQILLNNFFFDILIISLVLLKQNPYTLMQKAFLLKSYTHKFINKKNY